MLVCHCNGISDRTIRRTVRDGAKTSDEVAHACGAGACCGGCVQLVEKIIRHETSHRDALPASPVTSLSVRA